MVDRLCLALAGAVSSIVRLAGTAALVVGVLIVLAVLTVTQRSRSGLRCLYAPAQDDDKGHDDRGAVSLVEMVVVTALASVLLFAIASVAMVSERSGALASANYGAARRANTVLSSAMNAISDASPVYGCVLTNQGQSLNPQVPGAVYSVSLTNCARYEAQPQPDPTAVAAFATSNGGPQGLCWYSYPGSGEGLVAPDLRCLVAYPDHTIWSFDWPPTSGLSYTQCNPSSCFGTTAPAPGSLPSEPGPSTGSVAAFAGRTQAAQPFAFMTSDGQPATTSSSIYEVQVQVVEDYGGAKAENFSQSYTYKAYVGSAVQGSEQSWQSI